MQLSTLVLPAPFGPMSASSSPASSTSDTPSSTLRPPKPSCTSRKSSSAIPAPRAAVLFDVAIAASRTGPAEVELRHVGMRAQTPGRPVEHDAAALHHIAIVGDVQRHASVL